MTTCDLCTRDSLGLLSVDLAPPAFPALLHSDQPEEDDDDGDDDSNDHKRHDDYDDYDDYDDDTPTNLQKMMIELVGRAIWFD